MPVLLWVAKPALIFGCLEPGQLSHVDAVSIAQGEKLPEIVVSWFALEFDYQASAAVTRIVFNARYARQPFKERSLVVCVVEKDARIHVGEDKRTLGHLAPMHDCMNSKASLTVPAAFEIGRAHFRPLQ
jgi:hypothetical protein